MKEVNAMKSYELRGKTKSTYEVPCLSLITLDDILISSGEDDGSGGIVTPEHKW